MSGTDNWLPYLEKNFGESKIDDVEVIICDNIAIKQITVESQTYLNKFPKTIVLGLNACHWINLKNFPKLPKWEDIQLTDNHIPGSELASLLNYPNLTTIKLANNPINKIEEVEVLAKWGELNFWDLSECPVTKVSGYRKTMFEKFPNLVYWDRTDKEGNHYSDFEEEEDENEENEADEEENEEDSFINEEEENEEENKEEDEDDDGDEGEDDEDEEEKKDEGAEVEGDVKGKNNNNNNKNNKSDEKGENRDEFVPGKRRKLE